MPLVLLAGCALLSPAALAQKTVVRIVLNGPVLEAPAADAELAALFGQKSRTLYQLTKQVRDAARDPNVAGAALILDGAAVNLAQVEELSRAFGAFRQAGKKVYCYLDEGSNGSYALAASCADHITLAENSSLTIVGLHAEASYYKGMLDKIGVQADMLHCGAYKSALEPYTRTEPSKEAAENINWLLDGIYERWVELMAEGRKIPPTQMAAIVDGAPVDALPALEKKLVDSVGSFVTYKQMLTKEFGPDAKYVRDYGGKSKLDVDFNNPFAFFELFQKISEAADEAAKPGVGLIYITGPIMTGRSESSPFGGGETAGSTTIRAALEAAREAPHIRAVVVRVDSPGGSALASDIMWEAATRLGKEKPLIVSMGRVAGSGGYYVAIPGDTIFAEATTITGSIGVVGGKLVWRDLWEDKIGISTTEFNRGRRAGLMSMNRPWDQDERAYVQKWMDDIYAQFKGRVMTSRGPRIKGELENLAAGRVFTGRQALDHGLVDQIGGLTEALAMAASKAGLEQPPVYVLPKPKDLGAILAELFGKETADEYELKPGKAAATLPMRLGFDRETLLMQAATPLLRDVAPAQLRRIAAGLRQLLILDQENIGAFMPFDLEIR